jgi:hypothetical protein
MHALQHIDDGLVQTYLSGNQQRCRHCSTLTMVSHKLGSNKMAFLCLTTWRYDRFWVPYFPSGSAEEHLELWPYRSPNFTTLDFHLWVCIRDSVYISSLPWSVEEHKDSLKAITTVDADKLWGVCNKSGCTWVQWPARKACFAVERVFLPVSSQGNKYCSLHRQATSWSITFSTPCRNKFDYSVIALYQSNFPNVILL